MKIGELNLAEVREFFSGINSNDYIRKDGPSGIDALFAVVLKGDKDAEKNYIAIRWTNPSYDSWKQNTSSLYGLNYRNKKLNIYPQIKKREDEEKNLLQLFNEMLYTPINIFNNPIFNDRTNFKNDKFIEDDKKTQVKTFLNTEIKNISDIITAGNIADLATSPEAEIKDLIENGQYQIILTGAPGTGKTYLAKKIAKELSNKKYEIVQFHPSYDYTDFVEGLRPVDIDGQMQFRKVDGTFKKFCRFVAEENNKSTERPLYFFIIDEINRSDLSKVFGELMFALESDKRGTTITTQYSNIKKTYSVNIQNDVFEDGFFIPENIVIIGTMNDIDRSVESMDFALRRRFVWKEVVVNEELLKGAFDSQSFFAGKGIDTQEISKRVVAFNNEMHEKIPYLNRNYDISQGQFANMPDNKKSDVKTIMGWVWKYRVESLLREYLRGDSQIEKYIDDLKKQWFSESKSINNSSDSQNNNADDGTQK